MTKLLTALTAVMTLVAIAAVGIVKPKIFPTFGAEAAPPTVTISVEELQRQMDMRTLPITEIENLY
jgi:predicted small lipoprotein YifL